MRATQACTKRSAMRTLPHGVGCETRRASPGDLRAGQVPGLAVFVLGVVSATVGSGRARDRSRPPSQRSRSRDDPTSGRGRQVTVSGLEMVDARIRHKRFGEFEGAAYDMPGVDADRNEAILDGATRFIADHGRLPGQRS